MKGAIHVVKIGGKLINDEPSLWRFLDAFQYIPHPKILVHGGGRKATELSALLGIETKLIEGRRITSAEALEVAVMVYAGLINKRIVAQLQSRNINAIGLCGADGDIIRAHKRPVKEVDFGFVGDIDYINTSALKEEILTHATPVISAISHDGHGQLLNTNADTIAAQISIALSEEHRVNLSYCFEYPGVLYDLSAPQMTMNTITEGELTDMKESGAINSGMIPKLTNGFDALRGGVRSVTICGIDNLSSGEGGTLLTL